MLISFILFIVAVTFGYLFWIRNNELKELQKYSARLENDLLQQQIKFEEVAKHAELNSLSDDSILIDQHLTADALTGLPSTLVFEDRLLQTLNLSKRFGKTFGVLLLEVSGINTDLTNLEKTVSDLLFKKLSDILNTTIRKIDTVVRNKNNLYLFLLPQLSQPETAAFVVNRILKNLEHPLIIENQTIGLKPHFGIAIYPSDGETVTQILDSAHDALEKSKLEGMSVFHFHNEEIQEKSNRVTKLTEFFQDNDFLHHFVVYANPQMDITTGKIAGVRVVSLMQHKELGMVRFDEFDKIAERENKNVILEMWLIEKIILQYRIWQQQGFTPNRLCLHISVKSIQNDAFIQQLKHILTVQHFDPHLLAIEVEAENFADNAASLQGAFTRLTQLGVQTAISVYSLGHLALQKITQLPISYLKADARLVSSLTMFNDNEHILSALLDLSKAMDLKIVCEGVDVEKQKGALEKLGFHIMEGKLFGSVKPIEFLMS